MTVMESTVGTEESAGMKSILTTVSVNVDLVEETVKKGSTMVIDFC